MTTVGAWRDFYLLGGGAIATLTGLLFVAMSIHLGEILAIRPLTRNIEVALYGILYQLSFCGFMLVPGVTLFDVGLLIVAAGFIFALASLKVGSFRSRVDTWTNVSFGVLCTPIGVLLMLGWAPALYLYALVFGLTVASLVRLCWRLLTMAVTGLKAERPTVPTTGDGLRRVSSR